MTGRSTLAEEVSTKGFNSQARQYYIGCARHVLDLAQLPEFKDAIAVLEAYNESPDEDNLDWLKEVFEGLKSDEHTRRDYGYTAVGEFYRGLLHVIERTIVGIDSVSTTDTFRFAEAAWCAGHAINSDAFNDVAGSALRSEQSFQNALYQKLL